MDKDICYLYAFSGGFAFGTKLLEMFSYHCVKEALLK